MMLLFTVTMLLGGLGVQGEQQEDGEMMLSLQVLHWVRPML